MLRLHVAAGIKRRHGGRVQSNGRVRVSERMGNFWRCSRKEIDSVEAKETRGARIQNTKRKKELDGAGV